MYLNYAVCTFFDFLYDLFNDPFTKVMISNQGKKNR